MSVRSAAIEKDDRKEAVSVCHKGWRASVSIASPILSDRGSVVGSDSVKLRDEFFLSSLVTETSLIAQEQR